MQWKDDTSEVNTYFVDEPRFAFVGFAEVDDFGESPGIVGRQG